MKDVKMSQKVEMSNLSSQIGVTIEEFESMRESNLGMLRNEIIKSGLTAHSPQSHY